LKAYVLPTMNWLDNRLRRGMCRSPQPVDLTSVVQGHVLAGLSLHCSMTWYSPSWGM